MRRGNVLHKMWYKCFSNSNKTRNVKSSKTTDAGSNGNGNGDGNGDGNGNSDGKRKSGKLNARCSRPECEDAAECDRGEEGGGVRSNEQGARSSNPS
ncbi:hypothetical protein ACLKA6_009668 [Drosophila palustris]